MKFLSQHILCDMVLRLLKKIQVNQILTVFQKFLILPPVITENYSYTEVEICTSHLLQVTSFRYWITLFLCFQILDHALSQILNSVILVAFLS